MAHKAYIGGGMGDNLMERRPKTESSYIVFPYFFELGRLGFLGLFACVIPQAASRALFKT
jgi:hypothetical protein